MTTTVLSVVVLAVAVVLIVVVNFIPKRRPPKIPRLPVTNPRLDDFKGLPPLCNGTATGLQCVHYWTIVHPSGEFVSIDETVKRRRMCMVTCPGTPDDLQTPEGKKEMPVYCNLYRASDRPRDPSFEDATTGRLDPTEGPVLARGDVDAITSGLAEKANNAVMSGPPSLGSPTCYVAPPVDAVVNPANPTQVAPKETNHD